ncbi:MAG TPA: alpha/beta hydrolase [Naasia sp.]|jgi:acetyl esterase
MAPRLTTRINAWMMSTVATRLVKPPSLALTDRSIPRSVAVRVPTRHGDVRCLITRPPADAPLAARQSGPPVTLNVHGGGFMVGNPLQDEHLVRGIAGEVGSVVVNIDYSISPRARFPRALEETYDVPRWVESTAPTMGWDGGRIAFSGGSAGGNLALGAMTLAAREGGPAVRAAALYVPAVDNSIPPETHTSPIDEPFVSAGLREMVDVSYFSADDDRRDPLASPIFLPDAELAALPPLLVATAEYDTFTPFIDDFVTRARSAGVRVAAHRFPAVDHDFYFSRSTPAAMMTELMMQVRDHLVRELA